MKKTQKYLSVLNFLLFYLVFFVFIFALCVRNNGIDFDFWARLIQGNSVFNTHLPCFYDFLSYSSANAWYDPEWLSSALFYVVLIKGSVFGITLLKAILVFLLVLVLNFAINFLNNFKKTNFSAIYSYFFLLAILQIGVITNLRCQLITFILVMLWILFLEKIRQNQNKYLLFLPFISILWQNLHGGVICAIGLLLFYAFGEFLNHKDFKKYLILFVICSFLTIVSPYGLNYPLFLLKSSFVDRSWISEWQSLLSFTSLSVKYYFSFVFLFYFSYFFKNISEKISFKKLDKTKLLVLFFVSILPLFHIKHYSLSIVILSVLLSNEIFFLFNFLTDKTIDYLKVSTNKFELLAQIKNYVLYFLLIIYSIMVFKLIPIESSLNTTYFSTYPYDVVEFIKTNKIKGKILTPFGYGSYFAYKTYPNMKIYMDGREEQTYSDKLIDYNMFFYNNNTNKPDLVLKLFPPDYIFMDKTSAKAYKLINKLGTYKQIFEGKNSYLFAKNDLVKKKYNKALPDFKTNSIFQTEIEFKN